MVTLEHLCEQADDVIHECVLGASRIPASQHYSVTISTAGFLVFVSIFLYHFDHDKRV